MNLTFALLFCTLSAIAVPNPEWHKGSVVLADMKVLAGDISLQHGYDLVLYRSPAGVTVFPAHKIRSVQYYDAVADINRRFVSVSPAPGAHQLMVEIVLQGRYTVVRKQKDFTVRGSTDARDFAYFIYADQSLVSLRKFRTRIFPEMLMLDGEMITRYKRRHGLNPNLPSDAIQLIHHFNKHHPQASLAKG